MTPDQLTEIAAQQAATTPTRRASFLPLFAAVGGVAAAASAIFWVTHRAGPAPLITTQLGNQSHQAATNGTRRDDSSGPVGVNIDSLPMAGSAAPTMPDSDAMSNALNGHKAPVTGAVPPPGHAEKLKESALPSNPYKAKDKEPSPPPAPIEPTPQAPTVVAPLPPDERAPLSRGAAMAALGSAASAAAGCKRPDGPTGSGSVSVTFSPDGPAKSVTVSAPFAGTAVGQCVATVFRGAHVPPFSGSSITLPKSFQIPQ